MLPRRHSGSIRWLFAGACAFGLAGCSGSPDATTSAPAAVDSPQRGVDTEPTLSIEVTTPDGQPMAGTVVGHRGSYDTRPRALGETDAKGRVDLPLDSPGIVFVTVGESARDIVHYGSSATRDTVVVQVDGPGPIVLTHGPEGTIAADDGRTWPLARSNERYREYLDELKAAAANSSGDPEVMAKVVEQRWTAIQSQTNDRLRKLSSIHYATFAAQAVGFAPFSNLLELVPPDDPAWVVQAAHLEELIWVMQDEALQTKFSAALRKHHDDAGLLAALLKWDIDRAAERSDEAQVLTLFRRLEDPRFEPTIGWRNVRRHDPARSITADKQLPPFTVQRTDAGATPMSEADLAGKAWVIQVWATWCKPCVEELDALPALYEQLGPYHGRLEFLSISTDDERARTLKTLSSRDIAWPTAWAPDSERLMKDWSFAGVPLTILIDETGTIVHVWDDAASMKSIRAEVETLLGSP